MKFRFIYTVLAFVVSLSTHAQQLTSVSLSNLAVTQFETDAGTFAYSTPLLSFEVNGKIVRSTDSTPLKVTSTSEGLTEGVKLRLTFTNPTRDTLRLSNVVPFGVDDRRVYITGRGDHGLSRTHLFRPGRMPVNVIVPDNAWELGFSAVELNSSLNVCALTRRDVASIKNGTRRRFETILNPGGSVDYFLYAELYRGEWQEGLKRIFQKRSLYDLPTFDDAMYQRDDLKWIRGAFVMHLLMAWDKDFYDAKTNRFPVLDFVRRGKKLYGGDDVICIWPTWPTLGVDQRNQFDMYRDLPGGLPALRQLADSLRSLGTRFFVAYNPWDESTRAEGHLKGLAELIEGTTADGVVLDTKGESSRELQAAADAVRKGVVMYSEGMAVPKDMPGIVSGRVHNALYYPPMLNLNKLIRPDFAIFRVAEVYKEPIRREYATSFFNGYGTEINQFTAGHPQWEDQQYLFFGKTSRILREHASVWSRNFTPLVPTSSDSIWVNAWTGEQKKVYTIFSLKPEGFYGPLIQVTSPSSDKHFVDLWNHETLVPIQQNGNWYLPCRTDAFHKADIGTNNEGAVGAVAELPASLRYTLHGNQLAVSTTFGDRIKIFAGDPSYQNEGVETKATRVDWNLRELFGRYEGKFVLQAFKDKELVDESVFVVKAGTPRLITGVAKTPPSKTHDGMVRIPAGKFTYKGTQGDDFIPYPKDNQGASFDLPSFWMDKFPVTNAQFKKFLDETRYRPQDANHFLEHWPNGVIPKGQENFPVVYVSYEDAQAFAAWAGKRLPTEIEWQYATQTAALNEWPWKQTKPVTRKEQVVTETLTVSSLEGIDPKFCNLGDGKLYAVGSYPKGANPFGLQDLVGCVWQLTNDVYESGSYQYIMMKGGSFFKPSSSWWYVQGGPRELHYRQFLLRVSPGFERNGTVGFRCVAD